MRRGHRRRRAFGLLLALLASVVGGFDLAAGEPPPPESLPAAGAPASASAERMRLVLLGTGTPNAEPDRSGPALAVVLDDAAYLVDAGPGVVRRAAAARDAGIAALDPPNLDRVFLTHLHSDHTTGLPDLLLTPWTLGRKRPLEVFGPRGTRAMMHRLEQAYHRDVDVRIAGLEPANRTGWKAVAHHAAPGLVFTDRNLRVTAFAVRHGAWREAFGYRFDGAGRSIVVSGDTVPSEAVARACSGCDVLVHEVYSAAALERREAAWQRYHRSAHTSGRELGELAARARPRLLVLTHELLWGDSVEELTGEIAAAGFAGRVVFGRDLDVF